MGHKQFRVPAVFVLAVMAIAAAGWGQTRGEPSEPSEPCSCVVVHPTRQPVAVALTESFSAGIPSVSANLYTVPAGKQFVLERAGAIVRGMGAENPRHLELVLTTASGSTRIPVGTFPAKLGATDSPFVSETIGVTLAAGTEIGFRVDIHPYDLQGTVEFYLHGYGIDAEAPPLRR
jgi:hypothetical protein